MRCCKPCRDVHTNFNGSRNNPALLLSMSRLCSARCRWKGTARFRTWEGVAEPNHGTLKGRNQKGNVCARRNESCWGSKLRTDLEIDFYEYHDKYPVHCWTPSKKYWIVRRTIISKTKLCAHWTVRFSTMNRHQIALFD